MIGATCINRTYGIVGFFIYCGLPIGRTLLPTVFVCGESEVGCPLEIACADVRCVEGEFQSRALCLPNIGHHLRNVVVKVERFVVEQIGNHTMIELHAGQNSIVKEAKVHTKVPFSGRLPLQVGVL